MKIQAQLLKEIVDKHSKFINIKNTIQSYIYFQVEEGNLITQSTNGNNYLTILTEGVEGNLRFCVEHAHISKALLTINTELSIDYIDEKVTIKGKGIKWCKLTTHPDNFPYKIYDLSKKVLELPAEVIKDTYKKLYRVIDKSDLSKSFDFVLVKVDKNSSYIAATDGLRIAEINLPVTSSPCEFKITKNDYYYLYEVVSTDEKIEIYEQDNRIFYKIRNSIMSGIDTYKVFPQYQQYLEDMETKSKIVLPYLSLIEHIHSTDSTLFALQVSIEKEKLYTRTNNDEGFLEKDYDISYQGLPIQFTINLHYLIDFFYAITEKEFTLFFDATDMRRILLKAGNFRQMCGLMQA